MAKIIDIELDKIRIDGGTQPRAKIDMEVVNDYSTSFELGANFPPIDVFFDGKEYWLADGFHRWHGARAAHLDELPASIHNGTQRDAILFAVGANATHGLKRTNEDKRQAVMLLLNDAEWSKWSNRSIADKCGVSHNLVNDLRQTMASDAIVSERKFITSTGKEATRKVDPPKPKPKTDSAVATEDAKPTKTEPEQEPEQPAPAKTWEVFDDITRLRQLIAKLHDNWVTESDRKIIAQFFRQCANEV